MREVTLDQLRRQLGEINRRLPFLSPRNHLGMVYDALLLAVEYSEEGGYVLLSLEINKLAIVVDRSYRRAQKLNA